MLRSFLSYTLTSIILFSQVGLPLHMHYCKGMLESVSVFFAAKCDDHIIPADLPQCCKKALANNCPKEGNKCCDDEVKVLKQDFTSLTPSLIKWVDTSVYFGLFPLQDIIPVEIVQPILIVGNHSDSGPPIYILQQALIFYA